MKTEMLSAIHKEKLNYTCVKIRALMDDTVLLVAPDVTTCIMIEFRLSCIVLQIENGFGRYLNLSFISLLV